jgi:pyruvate/2-oxoglutarate/acetoin dehydrogenase E1 component
LKPALGVTGRGAQHAQCLEPFFMPCPGLKIVAPATAYDAMGLLKAAVRDDDPVLIFEHKHLYGSKGIRQETGPVDESSEIPDGDYVVPIGKGITCEVIDPRSLWPLDIDLIVGSVKKTGRAVIVEDSPKQGCVGAEIGMQVAERIPDYLLAPVTRVAAPNTPAPFSPVMENFYVPQSERIAATVRKLLEEY